MLVIHNTSSRLKYIRSYSIYKSSKGHYYDANHNPIDECDKEFKVSYHHP